MLLHITARAAWDAAREAGRYEAPSLVEEGFIHCSTPAQLEAVANHLYRGLRDRVLLVIDPQRLSAPVRWEGADLDLGPFPHVYGPIALDAVTRVLEFPCGPDGRYRLAPDFLT